MKILKVAVGNAEEAYVERAFTDGLNIVYSDENNKGKTIVIQSMMFALGNNPIFPDSFEYKKYVYYIEIEHDKKRHNIARIGDSFVVKSTEGIRMFDSLSEYKRYWNTYIFPLPQISFNGSKKLVDMELFFQMFFVGQDGKDTSTIFNSGYYHKADFINMVLSYARTFESEVSEEDLRRYREQLRKLSLRRQEQLNLSEFFKSTAVATEYLSKIKDREAFQARVAEMDVINEKISETRKSRSRTASRKSLWNATLKELRSLNRNIEVGELRCMDCNSNHIAYKGTGKITYSFDVSTQEMRNQIIASIIERIASYDEEISKYDYDIGELQKELKGLMDDDEVTIENIIAYKQGYYSAEEIEAAILALDLEISEISEKLNKGIQENAEASNQKKQYYQDILGYFNQIREYIDPNSSVPYQDLFTKRGTVASGSEETVFYTSKIIALAEKTRHPCPIVMDSFRAEDLSTEKEKRVLELLLSLNRQCILTTTLKAEEKGKYDHYQGVTGIDYTKHRSNKLLRSEYVPELEELLARLYLKM